MTSTRGTEDGIGWEGWRDELAAVSALPMAPTATPRAALSREEIERCSRRCASWRRSAAR